MRSIPAAAFVSIGNYPAIVRGQLDIPAEQTIVCGMALGWADGAEPANALHTSRIPLETFVTFRD